MKNTPIDSRIVDTVISEANLPDFKKATIREVVGLASRIESISGKEFIRMEMGVPGLSAAKVGVDAEIDALRRGVASIYPIIDGVPFLKAEASRFIKAFVNVDIPAANCIAVVGSMQGTFTSFLVCGQTDLKKDTILFIDPGFPVQKQQLLVLGYQYESFDVYDYRGEKLREKLESYLSKGNISALVFSNPNNPAWICMGHDELKIIGELATKYDTIVMEDLAYFAMDFRQDLSVPFQAPYQPSVANYTDNYVMFISGSKAFSYAGQRIAVAAISDKLFHRSYPALKQRYGAGEFGTVYIKALYAISSGASHSAQCALAAMFKAASDGDYNFVESVKEYGRRAARLKGIFLKNGFKIVYDKDLEDPVADGFYFTISYPGLSGGELMHELMYYGVSAICLSTTGSSKEGLRACVSFIRDNQYDILEERMEVFRKNHPVCCEKTS